MLTRERPDFRTVDRWAIGPAVGGRRHPKMQAKDRSDPHAREEALRIARKDPLAGLSPDEAIAAVRCWIRWGTPAPNASDGTPGK
jgi:hypothetical protein